MCGIQAVALGANVGTNLFGAFQQSRAASSAGNAQMQAANQTARQLLIESQIADANARMAMIEAGGRMGQIEAKTRGVIAKNRVDAAARGLAVDQGSPLLDEAFVASQGAVDKNLIAANSLMEAANQRQRGAAAAGQAVEALGAGRQAQAAARYGVGAAWLGALGASARSFGGLDWNNIGARSGVSAPGGARIGLDPASWWS